jgi:hypothetical protein
MSQPEARAWWADVEHLREDLARKREARDDRPAFARVATRPDGRFARGQEAVVAGPAVLEQHAAAGPDTGRLVRLPARDARPRQRASTHHGLPREARRPRVASDRDPAPRPAAPAPPRLRPAVDPSADPAANSAATTVAAPTPSAPVRRAIEIRGQVPAPRAHAAAARPQPPVRDRRRYTPRERIADRPDRIAMWALIMAFALMAVALATG